MYETKVKIDGMMCGMCESHINDAIRNAFSVKKVSASHGKGEADIISEEPIDEAKLRRHSYPLRSPRRFCADVLEQKGVDVRVQTALEIKEVAEPYIRARAIRHLEKGRVVLFGCGIGSPFFSTDTAAVLRAAEINADVILLAKNIDGVYNADPAKDASAVKYDAISYEDVLAQHLAVMDSTATSLSMDNHIPVLVFALKDPENIIRAVEGKKIGTIVGEN